MKGNNHHIGLIDTNHNAKNFRYQFIGGSLVVWIGNYDVDTELFTLASIYNLLWQVKDFALDLLVLKLLSHDTLSKLCYLQNEELG